MVDRTIDLKFEFERHLEEEEIGEEMYTFVTFHRRSLTPNAPRFLFFSRREQYSYRNLVMMNCAKGNINSLLLTRVF